VGENFVIEDWDFDESHWQHWHRLAEEAPDFWGRLLERLLQLPARYWSGSLVAKAKQVSQRRTASDITDDELLPAWIMKFRGLPCLQDTRGQYRPPAELLRRTPDTEALLDVEPFVRAEHDTERNRFLLVKLGVRDTPTGPDRLLERLRALAKAEAPPVHEVAKWYHRLDQLAARCSTEELQAMRDAFTGEQLILTDSREWAGARGVFLSADEEGVPGAATVHPSVRDLSLWPRIGVAERATAELILEWLRDIPSGKKLSGDELRRVHAILPRHAERIWQECGHWLNLEGEWTPTRELAYRLTMQSLIAWSHLFPLVKQKTADLRRLPADLCQHDPFADVADLATCIEERIEAGLPELPQPERKPWIWALGRNLARIVLDDEQETERIGRLAMRLSGTVWQPTRDLETTPYIDGTPAGTARKAEAHWDDSRLYVEDRPLARLCKAVTDELARPFGNQELTEAIRACFERPPEFVTEYLEENFRLQPAEAALADLATASRRDSSERVRAAAVRSIGWVDSDKAVLPLVLATSDASSAVRQAAAEELARFKSPASLEAMVALFKDPDEDVRWAAVVAAGELRDEETVPALIEAMRDPSPMVANAAERALQRMGKAEQRFGFEDETLRAVPPSYADGGASMAPPSSFQPMDLGAS